MKEHICTILVVLITSPACVTMPPAQPAVAAIVAQTLQAMNIASSVPAGLESPVPVPTEMPIPAIQSDSVTPDGTTVPAARISFLLPNGMGRDATPITTGEVEFPCLNPTLGEMPARADEEQ